MDKRGRNGYNIKQKRTCPVGQVVKTPPSHGGNRGSTPLRDTSKALNFNDSRLFLYKRKAALLLARQAAFLIHLIIFCNLSAMHLSLSRLLFILPYDDGIVFLQFLLENSRRSVDCQDNWGCQIVKIQPRVLQHIQQKVRRVIRLCGECNRFVV